MDTPTDKETPISNKFTGTIKRVVHAPPYQIVTIALDPRTTPEITVAYIPVPGGPQLAPTAEAGGAAEPHVALSGLSGTPSGGSGGSSGGGSGGSGSGSGGTVTVTIPVPNAVISMSN